MRLFDAKLLIKNFQCEKKGIGSLYVISGNETLLVNETIEALRLIAQSLGYNEHISMIIDAQSDWSLLINTQQNFSLFNRHRILELRITDKKLGKQENKILENFSELLPKYSLNPDTVVLITLPNLEKMKQSNRWIQILLNKGLLIKIPTIQRKYLSEWICHRLAQQNQSVDSAMLEWLANKVEGNLLAANQEIIKLSLLYSKGMIDHQNVRNTVSNVAHYDIFDLRNAMLSGDFNHTMKILSDLKIQDKNILFLVFWIITEEIYILENMVTIQNSNQSIKNLLYKLKIDNNHAQLILKAFNRICPSFWSIALQHAHDIDLLIKGLSIPNRLNRPWHEITNLVISITIGKKIL